MFLQNKVVNLKIFVLRSSLLNNNDYLQVSCIEYVQSKEELNFKTGPIAQFPFLQLITELFTKKETKG